MKKLLIASILSFLFLFPVSVFAANASTAVTDDELHINDKTGEITREITVALLADDGTGAFDDLTLNTDTAGILYKMEGWSGYTIIIDGNHGGVEPQEDSEIYVYQYGMDLLDANGVNMVDNTTERTVHFAADGQPLMQPFVDTWTITVTQQAAATSSAVITLYLILK